MMHDDSDLFKFPGSLQVGSGKRKLYLGPQLTTYHTLASIQAGGWRHTNLWNIFKSSIRSQCHTCVLPVSHWQSHSLSFFSFFFYMIMIAPDTRSIMIIRVLQPELPAKGSWQRFRLGCFVKNPFEFLRRGHHPLSSIIKKKRKRKKKKPLLFSN